MNIKKLLISVISDARSKVDNSLPKEFAFQRDIWRYVRITTWAFRATAWSKDLFQLCKELNELANRNGHTFLTQYLKECMRLTMTALVRSPAKSSIGSVLVGTTKSGLPRIIPSSLRKEMLCHNATVIRAVLTVLSVYRILDIPGNLKLSTITDKFSGLADTLPQGEVELLWKERFLRWTVPLPDIKYFIIQKKGPNGYASWLSSFIDAMAWEQSPALFDSLRIVCNHTPGGPAFLESLVSTQSRLRTMGSLIGTIFKKGLFNPILGKLSEKHEAAGKIRVFAITDYWTQIALWPLHKAIFTLLKNIPQDGTFNQAKPLSLLNELLRGSVKTFSFDLSAATDRLPVNLQVQILSLWLGDEYAVSWKKLLTDRVWHYKNNPVRYSVGQPMGAYSSWAMLALTHHFIVQLAARRVGINGWFPHYAVLGDDVVIANESVANAYLVIMKDLGVGINMSKSLISDGGVFEFAKRLVSPTSEYTPLGPKNLWLALAEPSALPAIFIDLLGKGEPLSWSTISSMIDNLPKGLYPKGSINRYFLRDLKESLQMPGGYLATFEASIKGSLPLNWTTNLADGPQSVRTWAWTHAITKVVVERGRKYVNTITSLPVSLSKAVLGSITVYDRVHIPLTEEHNVELTLLFDESIIGKAYSLDRDKLLESERLHRLLGRYDPTDPDTIQYLTDLAKLNNSVWNSMTAKDLYDRLSALTNIKAVTETINLEEVELDPQLSRRFFSHSRKIRRLYNINYEYRKRVNREFLPVVYRSEAEKLSDWIPTALVVFLNIPFKDLQKRPLLKASVRRLGN